MLSHGLQSITGVEKMALYSKLSFRSLGWRIKVRSRKALVNKHGIYFFTEDWNNERETYSALGTNDNSRII